MKKKHKSMSDRQHNGLMAEAIERYLELQASGDGSVCDYGNHEDEPIDERRCLVETGGMCHWCQLEAALAKIDYRKIEAMYERERDEHGWFKYRKVTTPTAQAGKETK